MLKLRLVLIGLLAALVMRGQVDSIAALGTFLQFQIPAGWSKIPSTAAKPGPRQPGPTLVNTSPVHPLPGDWLVNLYYPKQEPGFYINLAMKLRKTNAPQLSFPDKDWLKDSLYRGQRIRKPNRFDYRGPKLFDQVQMLSSCEVVNISGDYVFFEYKKDPYHYYIEYDIVRINDTLELLTTLEGKIRYADEVQLDDTLKNFTARILSLNEKTFDRISKYRPEFTTCTDSFAVNGFWLRYPFIPGWKTIKTSTLVHEKTMQLSMRPEGYDDCYPKEITVSTQEYDYSNDTAKIRRQRKMIVETVKQNKFILPPKLRKLVLSSENQKNSDSLQAVQHWYLINSVDIDRKAFCIDSAQTFSHMIGVDMYSDPYHKVRITFRFTCTYEELGQIFLNDQLFTRFVLFIIEQNDFEKYYTAKK